MSGSAPEASERVLWFGKDQAEIGTGQNRPGRSLIVKPIALGSEARIRESTLLGSEPGNQLGWSQR